MFADELERFGERIAIIDSDGAAISYLGLAQRVDEAASGLPKLRTLVAIALRPELSSVVFYLAALRARHPVMVLPVMAPPGEAEVGFGHIAGRYPAWSPGLAPPVEAAELHPDLGVLLSTSGSTASPKLVRLARGSLEANARSIIQFLSITPQSRAITNLPLHYSFGLSVLNSHLAAGASVVLTDASVSSTRFWDLFERHAVSHLAGVPFTYEVFERLDIRSRPLPSLKTLTQAGGRLRPELVRTYAEWANERGVQFFVMYGQTEATARMAYLPPDRATSHSDCVGLAIPGGALSLDGVGAFGKPGVGELVYRGPNVMMGYATAAADLARGAELDQLHTGDLAEQTEDGLYRIVGRLSRFSKILGLRIAHDDIETYLNDCGLPADVAGDDQGITIATDGKAPVELASSLAIRFGLPSETFVVLEGRDAFRGPSGKPDYAAILKAGETRSVALRSAPDRAARAEDGIAALFTARFSNHQPAPTDSFVSCGGDSLSYVTFSLGLENALGFVPENWENLTIAELAALATTDSPAPTTSSSVTNDVAVRAAAICGVVSLHALAGAGPSSLDLGGGVALLLLLFGFNQARFQRIALLSAQRWGLLWTWFIRILIPYYVLCAIYFVYHKNIDISYLLLTGNYFVEKGTLITPLWFIQAIAQSTLFILILFSVPAARRLAARRPGDYCLLLIVIGIGLKLIGALILNEPALKHRTFESNFLLIALGWSIFFARRWPEKLGILVLCLVCTVIDWGESTLHLVWMTIGAAVMLFIPRIPVPSPLGAVIVEIGSATFAIYLSHVFVVHLIEYTLGLKAPIFAILASLIVGVGASHAARILSARLRPQRAW